MRNIRPPFFPPAVTSFSATAALLFCLAGCSSPDTVAANKAAEAQADLDEGRIAAASIAIRKAVAARDDVADYWLLKAHIDLKSDDRAGAFGDYEYVVQFDHSNLEALQALCQLGISAGPAIRVDHYADQLLLLTPNAAPALAAKGSVALMSGDKDKAEALADRVLAQDPQNMQAVTLKAQIMLARGKFGDAAALIEKTTDGAINPITKLKFLKEIYTRAGDRPSYEATVRRLAQAAPDDVDVQLNYADMLYQDGQNDAARSVIQKMLATNPANFHVAATALNVWLEAGPQALDGGKMIADAASLSLLMKAAYAQFASEIGRPDIAIAILHGVDQGPPTPENSDAKATLAYATGLTGNRAGAIAQLDIILDADHDPNQPRALLARARLLAAAGDYRDAIRDGRVLVANDRENATAHLALVDILKASGSADLSESALREALRTIPNSTRLAQRLVKLALARGDTGQAAQIARDLVRIAPMDARARQLAKTYGAASPDSTIR